MPCDKGAYVPRKWMDDAEQSAYTDGYKDGHRAALAEVQKPSHNIDYAAALRAVDECVKERITLVYLSDFVQMCRRRLNEKGL